MDSIVNRVQLIADEELQQLLDSFNMEASEFRFIGKRGETAICKLRKYGENVFVVSQDTGVESNSLVNTSELFATQLSEAFGISVADLVIIEDDKAWLQNRDDLEEHEKKQSRFLLHLYKPCEPIEFHQLVPAVSVEPGWYGLDGDQVAYFIENAGKITATTWWAEKQAKSAS